jgi:F-type H+-transporting ATPase subunit delta
MGDLRVASRYVKSLLGLAVEQGVLEEVHKDMLAFAIICKESRPFSMMLKSPVIRHERKRDILEKIFTGNVNKLTLAIMDILTRKNREPLLLPIAKEFHNAYNEYKGISKASITTTIPMDKSLRTEIEKIVKRLSDRKLVEIDEKVDKALIGGFILNIGDRQIDASIRSKLEKLKLGFSENPYIKEF